MPKHQVEVVLANANRRADLKPQLNHRDTENPE